MSEPLDSAALLAACASHSEEERVEAYEALGRLLFRIVYARVRGKPDLRELAADACQEALVVVWRKLETGRGPDAPERFIAWAARIATNKLLDELRRIEPTSTTARSKRVALSNQTSLEADDGEGGRPLGERLADPAATDIVEHLDVESLGGLLREIHVIPDVSEKSRIVLMRGFLEGLDDEELADVLRTSRTNVHVIRCRDLAKLRANDEFIERLRTLYDSV